MDIIYAFKAIFYNLTLCMSYTFDFGSYTFSLGSVIVGSIIFVLFICFHYISFKTIGVIIMVNIICFVLAVLMIFSLVWLVRR